MTGYMQILHDPVLQALVITLIFVLLGLTARATALILRAYWNHFVQVLEFDSKF
jgi:multisubunit Na+/H+ antiporter MnhC subunit